MALSRGGLPKGLADGGFADGGLRVGRGWALLGG